jgi:addiction module RelE/StbE family toxin
VYELEWSRTAYSDLINIIDYIADDNLEAAQKVKDDIESKANNLREFPEMGRPGRVENTRELIVWSNFILVYQAKSSSVKILRVLHSAQQWPPNTESV